MASSSSSSSSGSSSSSSSEDDILRFNTDDDVIPINCDLMAEADELLRDDQVAPTNKNKRKTSRAKESAKTKPSPTKRKRRNSPPKLAYTRISPTVIYTNDNSKEKKSMTFQYFKQTLTPTQMTNRENLRKLIDKTLTYCYNQEPIFLLGKYYYITLDKSTLSYENRDGEIINIPCDSELRPITAINNIMPKTHNKMTTANLTVYFTMTVKQKSSEIPKTTSKSTQSGKPQATQTPLSLAFNPIYDVIYSKAAAIANFAKPQA